MPTYLYTCVECENNWEVEQRITEDALKNCPSCNKDSAKRLISGGTGFQLIGQCWSSDNYTKK